MVPTINPTKTTGVVVNVDDEEDDEDDIIFVLEDSDSDTNHHHHHHHNEYHHRHQQPDDKGTPTKSSHSKDQMNPTSITTRTTTTRTIGSRTTDSNTTTTNSSHNHPPSHSATTNTTKEAQMTTTTRSCDVKKSNHHEEEEEEKKNKDDDDTHYYSKNHNNNNNNTNKINQQQQQQHPQQRPISSTVMGNTMTPTKLVVARTKLPVHSSPTKLLSSSQLPLPPPPQYSRHCNNNNNNNNNNNMNRNNNETYPTNNKNMVTELYSSRGTTDNPTTGSSSPHRYNNHINNNHQQNRPNSNHSIHSNHRSNSNNNNHNHNNISKQQSPPRVASSTTTTTNDKNKNNIAVAATTITTGGRRAITSATTVSKSRPPLPNEIIDMTNDDSSSSSSSSDDDSFDSATSKNLKMTITSTNRRPITTKLPQHIIAASVVSLPSSSSLTAATTITTSSSKTNNPSPSKIVTITPASLPPPITTKITTPTILRNPVPSSTIRSSSSSPKRAAKLVGTTTDTTTTTTNAAHISTASPSKQQQSLVSSRISSPTQSSSVVPSPTTATTNTLNDVLTTPPPTTTTPMSSSSSKQQQQKLSNYYHYSNKISTTTPTTTNCRRSSNNNNHRNTRDNHGTKTSSPPLPKRVPKGISSPPPFQLEQNTKSHPQPSPIDTATTASSHIHNDHDSDIEEQPTIDELVQQCWTCSVPLHCNNRSSVRTVRDADSSRHDRLKDTTDLNHNMNNNSNFVDSLYAMHTHEILGHVPLCCICAEDVAAFEQEQQRQKLLLHNNKKKKQQHEQYISSYCSGCAVSEEDYDGVFLLCDSKNEDGTGGDVDCCSRVFCLHCVSKSYGGGTRGMTTVQQLVNDDDQPWICPCCNPPTTLQSLQQMTVEYYQLQEEIDQQRPRNELLYLLEELIRAEVEKDHCEDELSTTNVENKKVVLRQDIIHEIMVYSDQLYDPNIDYDEIDGLVQDAFEKWNEDWNNHERRISDYISVLLDELDIDHEYTAAMCYQAIGRIGATSTTPVVYPMDEDWVRAANSEIDQRMQQEKKKPTQKSLPDSAYEVDDFVDVEDLDVAVPTSPSRPQDDAGMDGVTISPPTTRDGFASNHPRPSQQSILSAIRNESLFLNVKVKYHISDDQDQNYIYAETMQRTIAFGDSTSKSHRNNNRQRSRLSLTSNSSTLSSVGHEKNRDLIEKNSDSNDKGRHSSSIENAIVPQLDPATPIELDHFYDCDDSPGDATKDDSPVHATNASMELIQDLPTPKGDDASQDINVAVHVMDESLDVSPSNNVNPHTVNTSDRNIATASPLPNDLVDSLEKGRYNIDEVLSPMKNSEIIISNNTSNKKRQQAISIEPFSVNTSSKKKKATASKTVCTPRVPDPSDVTNQKQQQFDHPPMVLCQKSDAPNKDGKVPIRTVQMAKKLWATLKPHQIEGIRFMWRNSFSDFAYYDNGNPEHCGGCILAHNMGLGKSLSTIALLHTVMTTTPSPLVRTVLLVVPVNTIANWENEFYIWQKNLSSDTVVVTNLGDVGPDARTRSIRRWVEQGGVLLISDRTLANMSKLNLQPDVLVLDEAHTMVRNSSTKIYKALDSILTPRKIGLTGSPFQNNLLEYFHLFNFVRPNVLGYRSEKQFDNEYVKPITLGMSSNCNLHVHYASLEKSRQLNAILDPFVHRVDSSELRKDLPPMQQVVIHVRQTSLQSKLYRAYKRYQRNPHTNVNYNSFLKQISTLRPIHNHPGSLLFVPSADESLSKKQITDIDEDLNVDNGTEDWWRPTLAKYSEEEVKRVANGNKVVLLLHILTQAQLRGDKAVIFANSIATLEYLEYILALDWKEHVPSLASAVSPNVILGRWQKAKEYVRIDGSISGAERGELVDQFEGDVDVKAFLISKAGGIGINLVRFKRSASTAKISNINDSLLLQQLFLFSRYAQQTKANLIVLFDQHFNPTVSQQAIYRLYRYGQTKPVFCYTLLTQGTTEEKVYGRCVNKTGVAFRVIDKKTIERCFTAEELEDLLRNLIWVQCTKCEKWRVLVNEVSEENVPDEWDCSMNTTDKYNNTCAAVERSQSWYEKKYFSGNDPASSPMDSRQSSQQSQSGTPNGKKHSSNNVDLQSPSKGTPTGKKQVNSATAELVENDDILKHLIDVTAIGKNQKIVCDYYFHDTIMKTKQSSDEIETIRRKLNP